MLVRLWQPILAKPNRILAEPCPELVSSEHFQTDEGLAKKTLYKLICARETELWKSDANAQALLQSAAEEVLKFNLSKKNINSKKIPPQITRHAILCDIPIPDLKPDESQFHDPLPPENPILDYEPKVRRKVHAILIEPLNSGKRNRKFIWSYKLSITAFSGFIFTWNGTRWPRGRRYRYSKPGTVYDIFIYSVIKNILSRFEIWLHPCRIY